MSQFTIVIGNKNYSSWSLRGWLALRVTGAAFDEVVHPRSFAGSQGAGAASRRHHDMGAHGDL